MKIDAWLDELKIPREAYRMVMLLPLVYVAWADGRMHSAERKLILQIAQDRGLLASGGREVLEFWLADPPTKAQLKTNLAIMNELCRSSDRLCDEFDADAEQLLLAWCQDVADAAGGLLGLVPARRESEEAALKLIADALEIRGAKNWRAMFA